MTSHDHFLMASSFQPLLVVEGARLEAARAQLEELRGLVEVVAKTCGEEEARRLRQLCGELKRSLCGDPPPSQAPRPLPRALPKDPAPRPPVIQVTQEVVDEEKPAVPAARARGRGSRGGSRGSQRGAPRGAGKDRLQPSHEYPSMERTSSSPSVVQTPPPSRAPPPFTAPAFEPALRRDTDQGRAQREFSPLSASVRLPSSSWASAQLPKSPGPVRPLSSGTPASVAAPPGTRTEPTTISADATASDALSVCTSVIQRGRGLTRL